MLNTFQPSIWMTIAVTMTFASIIYVQVIERVNGQVNNAKAGKISSFTAIIYVCLANLNVINSDFGQNIAPQHRIREAAACLNNEHVLDSSRVDYQRFTDHLTSHLRFMCMMLSMPVAHLGQTVAEMILVGFCLVWGMVITGVFQVSLISEDAGGIIIENV